MDLVGDKKADQVSITCREGDREDGTSGGIRQAVGNVSELRGRRDLLARGTFKGTVYFDASYRPWGLPQQFIGIAEKGPKAPSDHE